MTVILIWDIVASFSSCCTLYILCCTNRCESGRASSRTRRAVERIAFGIGAGRGPAGPSTGTVPDRRAHQPRRLQVQADRHRGAQRTGKWRPLLQLYHATAPQRRREVVQVRRQRGLRVPHGRRRSMRKRLCSCIILVCQARLRYNRNSMSTLWL